MRSINVSQLKTHLSRYLRMASRGTRIVVTDGHDPIAQIGPPDLEALPWHDRVARAGWLRLGSQRFDRHRITRLDQPVDIQASLKAVRDEPLEVRRP